MKLLHIIASMDPATGGPCQGIRNLNSQCEKLGIFREIVSMDDPNADFLGKDDFIIHPMGPTKSPWQYTKKLYPWLIKNLCRFDAVIVNGIWLYHTYAARKAIKQLHNQHKSDHSSLLVPKMFIMPHGMLDPYFQDADGRKLKAIRNWIYWKCIEEKNIRSADGLFFTCALELEVARKTFSPYKPKQELNVSYGVDVLPPYTLATKTSFREKCPLLKDSPYFLFLSRIHPKKGVDMLITAYIQLYKSLNYDERKSKLPKLVIAGPGMETAYGQKLKEMVNTLPELSQAIFFTGMLMGDAKSGALWGCEAFVLPSHQENFGIAVAEALSCPKPVLISDKINICAEIEYANAGFIANDTVEGTLDLLTRWINLSTDEKEIMRRNAGKCYTANFAIEKAANKLFETITEQSK